MRIVTKLGIAVLGAAFAMALLGAGTAAADDEVVLCAENQELCSAENIYPDGTEISALATGVRFLGGLNEECAHSQFRGEIVSPGGMESPLVGKTQEWSFTGCKPCTTVTVTTSESPWFYAWMVGPELFNFQASLLIRFSACPLGLVCSYKGSILMGAINTPGGMPLITANGDTIEREATSSTFCPGPVGFDGQYVVEWPNPVFFSLYEL